MKAYIANKFIPSCRFVKFNGGVECSTSSTDKIVGISDTIDTLEGSTVDIACIGEMVPVESGGAIKAGDALTSDALGCAVVAKDGDNIGAIAYQSASAAGELILAVVNIQRTITNVVENEGQE